MAETSLWSGVLLQAIEDLQDRYYQKSAERFLFSPESDWYFEQAGIEPEAARMALHRKDSYAQKEETEIERVGTNEAIAASNESAGAYVGGIEEEYFACGAGS